MPHHACCVLAAFLISLQMPIPDYKALPHEPGCQDEGLLVCANGHIEGRQGVALDDLVYIMTR